MLRPNRIQLFAWLLLITGFNTALRSDTPTPRTKLVISEFLAINDSGIQDEDGDHSDWLELYNYGATTLNLRGHYLTDSKKTLQQWVLPNVKIGPESRLIVFLSGKDRTDPDSQLHTNFSLAGKGEYLALIAPDGKSIVHEYAPKYPNQKADISFGLAPDWLPSTPPSSLHTLLDEPTPGHPNTAPIKGRVAPVKFSQKRGWHQEAFELRLRTKTEGAQIRYTLDGSLPTALNGKDYVSPITIGSSTVVRAVAVKPSYRSSAPRTRTYLFVEDVLKQSPDGLPAPSFPFSWGENKVNYGMDPRIAQNPEYANEIRQGFFSIPSFSIVFESADLFDREKGIYANAEKDGKEWERPCSMELIHGDGSKGFQIDCGIRMRGGFSRRADNPKHSFRFFFRDEYGPAKLDYPLFGDQGAKSFDHIDLRTFQNYGWHLGSREAIFLRDQFNRDLQLAMGQPAARGEYCHLFLNGQYWGLYNTCERIKASYGAAYFGGRKEDYDSIKKGRSYDPKKDRQLGVMANDGNLDAWERLWTQAKQGIEKNAAYYKMLGRHPDGSINPDAECLLDVDNLIDYMLVIFYGGNYDGPVSAWGSNRGPNNWYGIRNRTTRDGFRFFIWDAEHTLKDKREDRTGPFPAGDHFGGSNPQWIWQQCLENEEFRIRVGDRIQKHFFNGGALTVNSVRKRFLQRAKSLESAALCESARWGDAAYTPSGGNAPSERQPRTREAHWQPEIDRIANDYIPARSEIILAQLFGHGLISDVAAPDYSLNTEGTVQLSSRHGDIFYTLDGTDPRLVGGEISTSARKFDEEETIRLDHQTLKVRTLYRNEWSALVEVQQ